MAGENALRCDRARQWVSLGLDGELSQLETRLLERHVATCPSCREWQDGVVEVAAALRSAPLERPSRRLEIEPREQARLPLRRRLVVAAVVVAAVLGSLLGAALDRSDAPAPSPAPSPQFSLLPPPPADEPPARLPPVPGEDAV